ncbi:MAG TPA: hypothetical protein VKT70_01155, partial [Stellaceae bacterium]|nr:hypothetical protein [Stellaceae bacterium]
MRWGRRSLLATSSLVAMAASAPVLAQGVVTNPVPVNGVFTTTPGVTGVVLTGESFTGTILNAAPVTLGQYKVGIYTGIAVGTKSFNGAIINAGNIEVATNYPTNKHAFGIAVGAGAGGVFNGSVTNSGFITSREGYSIGHYIPPGLQGTVELADIAVRETVTGSIINTATGVIILPFGRVNSIGIAVDAPILGRIINAGYIFAGFGIDTGTGIAVRAPIMGGITNSGTLISTHIDIRVLAPLPRGITNSGFIGGKIFAPTDTAITVVGPIAGGISNTGIIAGAAEGNGIAFGTGTAFDLGAASAATVIRQSAGSIFGGIRFSSHADELLISGGAVGGGFVAPAGSAASIGLSGGVLAIGAAEFSNTPGFIGGDPLLGVQNLAALRQSGGMVVLDVVNSTNAAEVPNVRAGVITLTSVAAALTNFSAVNAINAPSFAPGAS